MGLLVAADSCTARAWVDVFETAAKQALRFSLEVKYLVSDFSITSSANKLQFVQNLSCFVPHFEISARYFCRSQKLLQHFVFNCKNRCWYRRKRADICPNSWQKMAMLPMWTDLPNTKRGAPQRRRGLPRAASRPAASATPWASKKALTLSQIGFSSNYLTLVR